MNSEKKVMRLIELGESKSEKQVLRLIASDKARAIEL